MILIYFEKLFLICDICSIILIQMDVKSISHVAKFRFKMLTLSLLLLLNNLRRLRMERFLLPVFYFLY